MLTYCLTLIFSYEELFDKIDITNEGVVNWEKFVQFLLLELYEEEEKVKTTQVNAIFCFKSSKYLNFD